MITINGYNMITRAASIVPYHVFKVNKDQNTNLLEEYKSKQEAFRMVWDSKEAVKR